MKRLTLLGLLVMTLLLTLGVEAQAQVKVLYREKKGNAEVSTDVAGEIVEESPSGIVVKPSAGANKTIGAGSILDIVYTKSKELDMNSFYRNKIGDAERAVEQAKPDDRKTALIALRKLYQDLLKNYGPNLPVVKDVKVGQRHVEYKIARLTARLGADDKGEAKTAADLLLKWKKDNPTGWQITAATETLAELQMATENFKGAAQTYTEMSKMKDLPEETRRKLEMSAAVALAKGKDFKEAETQLTAILKNLKPGSPDALRTQLYLANVQSQVPGQLDKAVVQLKKLIGETKDDDRATKALAHNTLGDCYMANDKTKDALYEYLYVDMLYPSDRDEQAKACAQLAKIFEKLRQPARAKEYAEKAEKLKK